MKEGVDKSAPSLGRIFFENLAYMAHIKKDGRLFVTHFFKNISRSNANVAIKSRMKEGVEKSAPSFGRPLGDVECDEGLKLRITTPIKGNPIPEFCWTKDGKPLSGDRVNSFSDGELVSSLLPFLTWVLLLKSISFTVSLFSFVFSERTV